MSNSYKHRECSELINNLMRIENAKKIIDEAKNDKSIFIGIRNNAIELYSDGASIIKYCMKNEKVCVEINKKFLREEGKGREVFDDINKIDIVKFRDIKKEAERIYEVENKKEKKRQQWIVNKTNNDSNNKWYYVDMEYDTQGKHLGRFDMVAISRKPSASGKHTVKLVELKVGTGAYGGSWIKKYNNNPADDTKYCGNYSQKYKHELVKIYNNICAESEISTGAYDNRADKVFEDEIVDKIQSDAQYYAIEKNAQYYEKVKMDSKFLFEKECNKLKFGSGIVGHIADYLKFLGGESDNYDYLKENIKRILDCKKQLGLEEIPVLDIEQLEDKPEIDIVTYLYSPNDKADRSDETIETVKNRMKEVISGKGEYTLKGALNSKYISDFLKLPERFNNNETHYTCNQDINGKDYKFEIRFIAPDCKMEFPYDCLSEE